MIEKYILKCIYCDKERNVIIQATENDDNVEVAFFLEKIAMIKIADNFFEALVELRKELENQGIKLLCKGCCLNVYPSAMLLGMGAGRKAYALTLGEQAKRSSLVDIFEPCELKEYASIDEQQNFFNKWCNSIGG